MQSEHMLSLRRNSAVWRIVVYTLGAILISVVAAFLARPAEVQAAQTVPYKINFQGRLANNAGNVMPNGLYNMRFKLYDASTGGTLRWSENREFGTPDNRVQVTNGLFSVQLGDVNALPLSVFTTYQDLYFEIELPTPGTATCSTAACASFTEGPMTPRNKLAASPYAMNADTVDGIDGANIAQVNVANSFTAAQTVNVASTAALDVKNGATSLLIADTTNSVVKVGTTGTATLGTSVRLLSTSAEFSGTVRIGDATNGVEFSATGITYRGTARPTKSVALTPEYAGATFTGTGTGNLSSDFCSATGRLNVNATACPTAGNEFNYYSWTSTATGTQTYDIYVRYRIPSDFDSGSLSNLAMSAFRTGTSDAVELALYQANGSLCGTATNIATGTAVWTDTSYTGTLSSCTIAAGDTVTFRIRLTAASNGNVVRAGAIRFDYRARF